VKYITENVKEKCQPQNERIRLVNKQ